VEGGGEGCWGAIGELLGRLPVLAREQADGTGSMPRGKTAVERGYEPRHGRFDGPHPVSHD